jgi:hypothetical protein
VDRIAVISTDIAAIGYDSTSRVLEIEFRQGRLYQYSDVPPTIYEELLITPSKGSFFHGAIKDRYPCKRVR